MTLVNTTAAVTGDEALSTWFLERCGSCCREGDVLEVGSEFIGAAQFCGEDEEYQTADFASTDWTALRAAKAKRFKFVHLTADSAYDDLRTGIETARILLRAQGVIAVSRYHTGSNPGSAAAVWQAVLTGALRPICATRHRFYGMWGDTAPVQHELLVWMASHHSGFAADVHHIEGHRLLHFDLD
ncbi:hypothetical protein [Actinomadura hibisca]|uniref:hypothetical protein n=1 Tax=Actinomadura hibisca TaxID=68565 RepID=UPI000A7615BD|nr:hypothetical protein [Actinomadura hibisca]